MSRDVSRMAAGASSLQMRRALLLAAVVLLGLGVPTVALLALDGHMPWRGVLTRELWADVARGRVPALACAPRPGDPWNDSIAGRMAMRGEQLCRGAATDSSYVVDVDMADGWVYGIRQEWRVASATGPALADSLAKVVIAERGKALGCPRVDGEARSDQWKATADAPYRVELRVRTAGDSARVSLVRRHADRPCGITQWDTL